MATDLVQPRRRKGRRPAGPSAKAARGSGGGIGRASTATAEAVSDQLRRGTDGYLDDRRRVAALALGSTGALGVVSLYQTGLLKHVPEPPLRFFDADKVDASGEAYRIFSMPDAILGMLSSVATLPAALPEARAAWAALRRP